ncbi:P450 domain-containing protein [Tanacetum coccineum]
MPTDERPPVIGSIFYQFINFKELYDYMASLAKKYPTFRFVTPTHSEVYTADPVNVEYILKTNFANYTKGEYINNIMRDIIGSGIFAVDGEKWHHQRKLAGVEFATKALRDFSTLVFKSNTIKLSNKIFLFSDTDNIINMQDLLMKTTLDAMIKVGFGFDLDGLSGTNEASNRFIKAFNDSNDTIYWRLVDFLWKVKRYLNVGYEAALKENIKTIDKFVYELIQNKRNQMKNENIYKDKEDILSRFLIESESDPKNMNDKYIRDIILSLVFAGMETTADTLTWFFYMLCKNPLIQEKVAEEVKTVTKADNNTSIDEFGIKLTKVAIDKMHYLHATLTETLRLYPAIPLASKRAEKDDVLPDGFKIKKGDGVGYMAYSMGRMTYIWGDDAEEFRPERWLHNSVFLPETPFKFTAFQAGPRICIGKDFAYRQMKIMVAFLVYFFKFKLVDPSKEATYRVMFTLYMDKGLHLYATRLPLVMVLAPYFKELIFSDHRPPIIGPISTLVIHFWELHDYMTSLARKYPTCRFIAPLNSEIYTVDPVNIEYILKTNFANYPKGEYHTGIVKDFFGNGIFAVDGAKWRHQRKLASFEFSTKSYEILVPLFSDSIFKVGFGFNLDTLSGLDEARNRFMKAFDDSNGLVYWRLADLLWRVKSENDPENMNDKYLRDITLDFVIAGKDTTANTLTWFFYMLCKHPLIQEKIVEELKTATEADDHTSINEFGLKLTEIVLDRMHYLHAALSETLRLYPAVPLDGKSAAKDDVLPDGFKIKKGDGVAYMVYAMGRMTYIWGDDAEEFRPERWLNNGVFQPESPFKFTAFQGGPRICLGKDFAYRQMKILAAFLVYFFKFKLVDETKEATYRTMFTLHMDKGLHLYAFRRF